MTIHTPTNASRIAAILDKLAHLETSFASNKASAEDRAAFVAPIRAALDSLAPIPAPAPAEAAPHKPGRIGVTAPQWASVRDMAHEADLSDLGAAVLIYHDRVDQLIHDHAKAQKGQS